VAERVAGTSTELAVPSSEASPGMASDALLLVGAPLMAASSWSEMADILEVVEIEKRMGIKMCCE
jgi:hypothetical protein